MNLLMRKNVTTNIVLLVVMINILNLQPINTILYYIPSPEEYLIRSFRTGKFMLFTGIVVITKVATKRK